MSGLRGLPAGEEYDVVIAGAGLDAIESVEGERLGWDELLARLVAPSAPAVTCCYGWTTRSACTG